MELTKESVLEALGNMSVMEIIALTKQLEEKWGVKALPPPATFTERQEKVPDGVVQTEFTVMITSVPSDKKMAVIKAIRDLTGLGLKESKELAESAPKLVKENLSAEDAESLRARLIEAGAVVEIK